jgi:hypothetical protein
MTTLEGAACSLLVVVTLVLLSAPALSQWHAYPLVGTNAAPHLLTITELYAALQERAAVSNIDPAAWPTQYFTAVVTEHRQTFSNALAPDGDIYAVTNFDAATNPVIAFWTNYVMTVTNILATNFVWHFGMSNGPPSYLTKAVLTDIDGFIRGVGTFYGNTWLDPSYSTNGSYAGWLSSGLKTNWEWQITQPYLVGAYPISPATNADGTALYVSNWVRVGHSYNQPPLLTLSNLIDFTGAGTNFLWANTNLVTQEIVEGWVSGNLTTQYITNNFDPPHTNYICDSKLYWQQPVKRTWPMGIWQAAPTNTYWVTNVVGAVTSIVQHFQLAWLPNPTNGIGGPVPRESIPMSQFLTNAYHPPFFVVTCPFNTNITNGASFPTVVSLSLTGAVWDAKPWASYPWSNIVEDALLSDGAMTDAVFFSLTDIGFNGWSRDETNGQPDSVRWAQLEVVYTNCDRVYGASENAFSSNLLAQRYECLRAFRFTVGSPLGEQHIATVVTNSWTLPLTAWDYWWQDIPDGGDPVTSHTTTNTPTFALPDFVAGTTAYITNGIMGYDWTLNAGFYGATNTVDSYFVSSYGPNMTHHQIFQNWEWYYGWNLAGLMVEGELTNLAVGAWMTSFDMTIYKPTGVVARAELFASFPTQPILPQTNWFTLGYGDYGGEWVCSILANNIVSEKVATPEAFTLAGSADADATTTNLSITAVDLLGGAVPSSSRLMQTVTHINPLVISTNYDNGSWYNQNYGQEQIQWQAPTLPALQTLSVLDWSFNHPSFSNAEISVRP